MRRIVSALSVLLLWAASAAHAGDGDGETWYSVHLDGRKIGHMHTVRAVEGEGRVRHEQSMDLTVERSGLALRIATVERSWETAEGRPLAFETRIDAAGSLTRMRGEVGADGSLRVETHVGDDTRVQQLRWPEGALLPEGLALRGEGAGFAPGSRWEALAFEPGSLQALRIETEVGAPEDVLIHGRSESLLPLQQSIDMAGMRTVTRSWVTRDTHELRRLSMPALGLQLEMLACDRACALAPVQPTDILASTTVASPRALGARERARPLRYRLRLSRGDATTLDAPLGQRARPLETPGEYELVVDPRGDPGGEPRPEDTQPNRWLQSDAPSVRTLAGKAIRGVHGRAAQAQALEQAVRGHIRIKSLRVGYASASEIVEGQEGDCTEHAVLLAALMRAVGIPARVATGVAYVPQFESRSDVFVPHAWVLAWIDGRWRGYDAALPGHDAGHIAFSVGDGDPFRFYGGIELLGGVEVLAVEPARRRAEKGE